MLKKTALLSFVAAACLVGCSGASDTEREASNPDAALDATLDAAGNSAAAADDVETSEERTARLREKAKTDPEGADAEAIDNMSRNEVVATAINSAGFLCARVASLQSVGGGELLVDCVEYRNGTGRVSYRVNANSGTVEQR